MAVSFPKQLTTVW